MTPTVVASPEDMHVEVQLAVPKAPRLPRCAPVVAVPLSAASPKLPPDAAYALEAGTEFTPDELSWIVYLAKSAHQKDPSRTVDSVVEDAIERIGLTEYVPDGFGGCGP